MSRRRFARSTWKNGDVATKVASTTVPDSHPAAAADSTRQFLRHVMVVGGTLREWEELGDDRWTARVETLGAIADHAGASFLTLRAFEPGADAVQQPRWERRIGGCHVIIDPCGDGRERFAEAMQRLEPHDPVNEATVAEALYAPADCEPDLIVVLGESTRLPPSLVWELAYGELVFVPLAWSDLGADHLVDAFADFAQRERRFGGLDESDE
ncbi:MAG: hypothetical protein HKN44_08895 [Ilumatobacter sp.]|nr:hypothetical protein [Ilumatobacter sp.]